MKKLLLTLVAMLSIASVTVVANDHAEKKECPACKEKGSKCDKCAKEHHEEKKADDHAKH